MASSSAGGRGTRIFFLGTRSAHRRNGAGPWLAIGTRLDPRAPESTLAQLQEVSKRHGTSTHASLAFVRADVLQNCFYAAPRTSCSIVWHARSCHGLPVTRWESVHILCVSDRASGRVPIFRSCWWYPIRIELGSEAAIRRHMFLWRCQDLSFARKSGQSSVQGFRKDAQPSAWIVRQSKCQVILGRLGLNRKMSNTENWP